MFKLYSLSALCLAATLSLPGMAQPLTRQSVKSTDSSRSIVIPAADSRIKGAMHTDITSPLGQPMMTYVDASKIKDLDTDILRAPLRAKAAGAIQGYLGYVSGSYTMTQGWYNVSIPTSTNIWKSSGYYPSCGYVRNGLYYTWYHRTSTSEGLFEMGMKSQDLATGTVEDTETYGLFDGYDKLVWNCAYDCDNDIVYVISSRTDDADNYMTQTYDPETNTFTKLGDIRYSEWPIAMAWNPADGNVYTLSEDGDLYILDKKKGTLSLAVSTGHPISDYAGSMVYSPKDKGFVYMVTSYDDETVPEMGIINPANGAQTTLGYPDCDQQWITLFTSDPYSLPEAPQQAELQSWDFAGASLSGSMKIKMPTLRSDGSAISGSMYLEVTVDGSTAPIYDKAATAGAVVSVPLTLTEGLHNICVRPYVYVGIDKAYATALRLDKYAGNDIPAAPANVTITKTTVTWDACGAVGVNGGYVNTASLRYNVYVNGTKMNSTPVNGTSLNITLPAGYPEYTAEVEATAAGKTSERGVSTPLSGDGPLNLPVYLGPAEGETDMTPQMRDLFTIVNANGDNRTWIYDEQKEQTGGFYYLCSSDNVADDWLILPAINFDDANAVYSFNFEVWAIDHYFSGLERYEVGISTDTDPANMRIIKEATDLVPTDNFTPVDVMFKTEGSGVRYIGIHCISDANQYRLYARRFHVEKTQSSAAAPAAVTELAATGEEDGTLFANVTFKMPADDISGNPLPASTQVTATVSTSVDTKTVTAAPGASASVKVGAVQGKNMITVVTSTPQGQGTSSSVETFVGVDVPAAVLLDHTVSADNRSMTLNWDVPDRGENNGPVIAEDCTFTLMRNTGNAWVQYLELGKTNTYTFNVEAGTPQDIYQFGILATNSAGQSSTFSTVGDILGEPYGLPMNETFPYEGENVNCAYEPYMIQALSQDLYPSWGFVDPSTLVEYGVTPNDSGIALAAYWIGNTQVTLPKFSTEGMQNVKVDLSMFFGNATPSTIHVLGTVDNDQYNLLAEFTPSDGNGWEVKTIDLPAHMQNRKWVAITIRVTLTAYSQYFLLENYRISNYPGNDLAVTGIGGDLYGNIGNDLNMTATVRNLGNTTASLPQAVCKLFDGAQEVADIPVTRPSETVPAGEDAVYTFTYNPGANMLGNHTLRFSIDTNDEVISNNSAEAEMNIFNHNIPVPQNLTAKATDDGASLAWDEPQIIFGAEECMPGTRDENIGRFTNIDNDEFDSYALTGVNYPGRFDPIAFQVIETAVLPLPPLTETAGDNVIMTLASSQGAQDNWLISPEVKGGTQLSFKMGCAIEADDKEYMTEVIEVMVSTTDNRPESFTKVAEFSHGEVSWTDCEYTLPADARYFALHYAGETLNFCVFLDDIRYTPAAYDGDITGYRVTRGGDNVQTLVSQRTFIDNTYDNTRPAAWNVRTVMNIKGSDIDSQPSNSVILDPVGVNEIERMDSGIYGHRGYISIEGKGGKAVTVASADGRIIARTAEAADIERVNAPAGIYIVTAGKDTCKVIVR